MRRRVAHLLLVPALLASMLMSSAVARAQVGVDDPVGAARFEPASDIAIEYLMVHRADFDLIAGDVADIVVSDIVAVDDAGTSVVYLQQRLRGVPILGAVANVVVESDGAVVGAVSRFLPMLSSNKPAPPPALSAADAEAAALALLGVAPEDRDLALPVGDEDVPTRLVLQPRTSGALRLAWEVTIIDPVAEHWWQLRIDAATGAELDRTNLVSGDSYLVVAPPAVGPGWGPVDTLTNPADPIASPFGWHDTDGVPGAESTSTIGNNVIAYTDRDADNQPDPGSQPDGGPTLDFAFAFDPFAPPASSSDADVVSLFTMANLAHDVLYSLGFDEASGNFQTNNYGRGGLGGDPVRAEAQNGGALNNANFVTPPDGFPARMQFFLFDATDPSRSSSLDNTIVFHEYGHGLSNRLTGGPSNVSCLQNDEQAGEGWSDYLALVLTMDAGDRGTDARGIATYALGQPPDGPGIRGVPYSTDLLVDGRTYADLPSSAAPYEVGAVMTSTLWDLTWDLIDRHGFDADLVGGSGGNRLALALMVDALKIQPCNPGFVDFRDAMLVADQLDNGGDNTCLIWTAFARRGLGFGADQGSPLDHTDGVAAFDLPPVCAPLSVAVSVPPGAPVPGGTLPITVTVAANAGQIQTSVTASSTIPAGTTVVPGSIGCDGVVVGDLVTWAFASISPGQPRSCEYQVVLDAGAGTVVRYENDFESAIDGWTIDHGLGAADWQLTDVAANSGLRSFYAADVGVVSDQRLTTPPVIVGSATVASFAHSYSTEVPFDGGVIELSIDGGATWTDAGPRFITGGYDAVLSGGSNPLANRPAFSGDSSGFVAAALDLGDLAGEAVSIRFRFGSDGSVGADGWYVDDLRVADEVAVVITATAASAESSPVEDHLRIVVGAGPAPLLCEGHEVTVDLARGQQPTDGDDVIAGTPGDDEIDAGAGNDIVCGGAGDDKIDGGSGSDLLAGGAGDDELDGGPGVDLIFGDEGDDELDGNGGEDWLDGGPGTDELVG
ncbi:MAG: M36 family metallopeptidase [Acidimicrobiales bacterium]